MEIIREPLDVDFVVESRPLTKEEEKAISKFILADKEKRRNTESLRLQQQRKHKTKELV